MALDQPDMQQVIRQLRITPPAPPTNPLNPGMGGPPANPFGGAPAPVVHTGPAIPPDPNMTTRLLGLQLPNGPQMQAARGNPVYGGGSPAPTAGGLATSFSGLTSGAMQRRLSRARQAGKADKPLAGSFFGG